MSRPHNKTYTLKVLREGFERFKREHGHYPGAEEVDSCPYLCTARQIQRKFGGMLKLRETLEIIDSNYGEGDHRRQIGLTINKLAIHSEKAVGEYLKTVFGEICVHEEKRYGSGRNRVDFFVYANPNFAVEVFNTYTLKHLATNLNMKLDKFYDFPYFLYFVITGSEFNQESIDLIVSKKKKYFPDDKMKCICFNKFKDYCNKHIPLQIQVQSRLLP